MCTTVVDLDGTWLHSVGALNARGWPVTDADRDDDLGPSSDADDSLCLCGVDVVQVLERNGVTFEDDGSGFLDVVSAPRKAFVPPRTTELASVRRTRLRWPTRRAQ